MPNHFHSSKIPVVSIYQGKGILFPRLGAVRARTRLEVASEGTKTSSAKVSLHMSCSGVGTLDGSTHLCSCPLTHTGRTCESFRQPACSLDATRALRPLFWVKTITKELHAYRWRAQRFSDDNVSFGLGPLPCQCVRELLQTTAIYRSIFALMPRWLVCAATSRSRPNTVRSLLESGGGASEVKWANMSILS